MTRPDVFTQLSPEQIAAYLTKRGRLVIHGAVLIATGANFYWSLRQWREWRRARRQLQQYHDAEYKAMATAMDYARALAALRPTPAVSPNVCHGACDGCQLVSCRYDHSGG